MIEVGQGLLRRSNDVAEEEVAELDLAKWRDHNLPQCQHNLPPHAVVQDLEGAQHDAQPENCQ